MKVLRYCMLCCMLVATALLSQAQQTEIYVSATDGWDDWNSGVLTQPYKSVDKAIGKAVAVGAKEVRVAVGEYNLTGELKIPAGLSVVGGYKSKEVVRVQNPAEETVLIGNGQVRVATVSGRLDGVTVKGGFCKGGNGGGVYVKSSGKVVNCIVKENKATFLLPKVGDLLMKDGSFFPVSEFTPELSKEVKGVIFWVNPDKGADIGKQGYAVATDAAYYISWSSATGKTGTYCPKVADAVKDMNGKSNTDALVRNSDCQAAAQSRTKGAEWSLPACGQLLQLAVEWSILEVSFGKLWDKMSKKPGVTRAEMVAFFGAKTVFGAEWESSEHFMVTGGLLLSSTLKSNMEVWGVSDIYMKAVVGQYTQKAQGTVVYITEF